ncbi:MAG: hypothetical protein JWL87_32 [Candidatus Adlerbacteria bacterium]|nr:hypothetical protein [Candidatus Adlerbacteria bacterium]
MAVRLYSNVNAKFRGLGTAGITSMSQVVYGPNQETFFEADTRRREEIVAREKIEAQDAKKIRRVQKILSEDNKRRKKGNSSGLPRKVLSEIKKLKLKTKLRRKTKK